MKRQSFLLAAALLVVPNVNADEGMWTMHDVPQAVYEQMQTYGFELPYDQLYASDSAIMKSVVNFSGYCSGVVVSPDGLVFTNHHCGFEAIRSHSTVEHDYMLDGFYAETLADELPNEDMFVSFMVEQRDITDELLALGLDTMSLAEQAVLLDSVENAMSRDVREADSTLRLEIKPFYEGNKYYATTYRDFGDLRLVFAVPKSMGKFGGETDNWMWPRQTCDFSVFRIYADPATNGPAEYSETNVPYKPATWAQVSLEGYSEGDFSMTVGYPGGTARYLSSYGIREQRDAMNAPMAQVRGVKQEVMARHMAADEAVRIKYDSKYATSSNYWKNSIGMNKCIDSIGLILQKQEYEEKIRAWQDSTGLYKDKLDFDLMARLYERRFEKVRTWMYFKETFLRTTELTMRAMRLNGGMEVKGEGKKSYIEFEDNSDEWDAALDKEVLAVLLKNYAEHVDAAYVPDIYTTIDEQFGGNYAAYADYLYDNSILMRSGEKIYQSKKAQKKWAKDLGVQLGLSLTDLRETIIEGVEEISDSINELEKYLCAVKILMEEDLPHYSDANFTMRMSYGQVGGYEIGGTLSGYYTTAESIVDKMQKADEIAEYEAEPIMHEIMSADDFGPYADTTTGSMQLCFLTNNDITGGNSGSPMFDGKGRLIGLAFDGNWDSLSADIWFDSLLARCIGVDIRFVILMMDRWGHADRLLDEIFGR